MNLLSYLSPVFKLVPRLLPCGSGGACLLLLLGSTALLDAQTVTVSQNTLTTGYMDWSPLPGDAAGYGGTGSSTWALSDLQANFSGNSLILSPNTNTYAAGNAYWVNANGSGANLMDANIYNETAGVFVGTTLTFSYEVVSNTLASAYSSQAFIKDFAPDYSTFVEATAPLTPGAGNVRLLTSTNVGDHIQYGFETFGPDANPATVSTLGSVVINSAAATPASTNSLLSNQGFESDPTGPSQTLPGWTVYGPNVDGETGPGFAQSGSNYLSVYQDLSNPAVNYNGVYQDYISGPGATYTADGWAFTPSGNPIAGQNIAWIEVTFRDANANILALYRSALIGTNSLGAGSFPTGAWVDLPVTNQYNLNTYVVTNTVAKLTAPAGTYFVRYQIVFQGDGQGSAGSMYFDNLNLSPAGGTPYGNWNIVWSDEFNGTNINPAVWTYDVGNGGTNPGWGNEELEYYTSRTNNAYVSGGLLHVVAQQESYAGSNYTSARLKSQGLFSLTYGRLEWRAMLPSGTGTWPALWLLGTNITSIHWPECGEIDVMENNGSSPTTVQGSLHSGSDETGFYHFLNGTSVTGFHTYTLDWSTNAFLFYVDGHLYENQTSWSTTTGNAYPFPYNQPFFILMNVAIGGTYLQNPTTNAINAGTVFPAQMDVDYVRLYNITAPLTLSVVPAGNAFLLAWPSNVVAHLQEQTNLATAGQNTNWLDLAPAAEPASISPTNGYGFYRLQSP